jgi:hypothetical protein
MVYLFRVPKAYYFGEWLRQAQPYGPNSADYETAAPLVNGKKTRRSPSVCAGNLNARPEAAAIAPARRAVRP